MAITLPTDAELNTFILARLATIGIDITTLPLSRPERTGRPDARCCRRCAASSATARRRSASTWPTCGRIRRCSTRRPSRSGRSSSVRATTHDRSHHPCRRFCHTRGPQARPGTPRSTAAASCCASPAVTAATSAAVAIAPRLARGVVLHRAARAHGSGRVRDRHPRLQRDRPDRAHARRGGEAHQVEADQVDRPGRGVPRAHRHVRGHVQGLQHRARFGGPEPRQRRTHHGQQPGAAGHPARDQGQLLPAGVRTTANSLHLRELRADVRRDRGRAPQRPQAASCSARCRWDRSRRRARPRPRHRHHGQRVDAEHAGDRSRRLVERLGVRGRGTHGVVVDRHADGRIDHRTVERAGVSPD